MKKILSTIIMGVGLIANAQVTNGLIHEWTFNGNANDVIGTTNGTFFGAQMTTDRFGNPNSAYSFNGTNQYIDCGTTSFTLPVTVSFWVKGYTSINNSQWKTIFGWNDTAGIHNGIQFYVNYNFDIVARIGDANEDLISYTVVCDTTNWYFIASTRVGNTQILYVNGVVVDSSSAITDTIGGPYNLFFGRSFRTISYDEYFNGDIDDIRIYNRALSSVEIDSLYNAPNNSSPISTCSAGFTYSTGASGQVSFINNSLGAYNTWSFGDGTTSLSLNPLHTYAYNGVYSVTENVTDTFNNVLCSTTQTISITNVLPNTNSCNRVVLVDSFSNPANWTVVGGDSVYVAGGKCNFVNVSDGTYNKVYRSIGTTLSNTYWKAETNFSILNPNPSGSGVGEVIMALTAGNQDFLTLNSASGYAETNQDAIGVIINSNSPYDSNTNDWYFLIEAKKGNIRTYDTSTAIYLNAAISNYYVKLERISKGMAQLSIYSDSLFTTQLPGSPKTFVIDSTITGLNTIQHGTSTPGWYARFINATIDNDLICDDGNVPPACNSAFTYTLWASGQVSFTANSSVLYNTWSFGDGSTSNSLTPAHTYASNGVYTVTETVTDSLNNILCSSAQTIAVTNGSCNTPVPAVTYTLIPDSIPQWWSIFINYTQAANAIWYWGDGTTSTGLYPTHIYDSAAVYHICVTVYNVCGDSVNYCQNDSIYRLSKNNNTNSFMTHVNVINANATTGINAAIAEINKVNIYPNPNKGSFVIEPAGTAQQTMMVYDVNGKTVLSQTITAKTTIDASSLNDGVYNICIIGNGGVVNKRLVIVR